MKHWQIWAVSTAVTLAIGGVYLSTVWRHRHEPAATDAADTRSRVERLDNVAVVRQLFPTTFADLKQLEGKPVWMKNGYTMSYYPYTGGRVDFAKKAGVLPAAARLDVKKFIRVAVPAREDDGISPNGQQAFAVFTLGAGPDQFASPVGAMPRGAEAYYTDILYYYDDPHTIYDHWGKDIWAAVDAHQPKPGMTELEVQMAIGRKAHSDSQEEGNRTVTYNQAGKTWTVTFVDNQATAVKSE